MMSNNPKLKSKAKVCRICGRPSSVRTKKCPCGGKLVSNLEKSIEAMLETVLQERIKQAKEEATTEDATVEVIKAPLMPSQE